MPFIHRRLFLSSFLLIKFFTYKNALHNEYIQLDEFVDQYTLVRSSLMPKYWFSVHNAEMRYGHRVLKEKERVDLFFVWQRGSIVSQCLRKCSPFSRGGQSRHGNLFSPSEYSPMPLLVTTIFPTLELTHLLISTKNRLFLPVLELFINRLKPSVVPSIALLLLISVYQIYPCWGMLLCFVLFHWYIRFHSMNIP